MALFGFGVVVAPVLGPTLGGWLTDTYSWRYAFYINIPVGLLALFMINRFVHDPSYIKHARVPAFDNLGFGALVVWTGLLQIILDKGQEDDWFGALWLRWAFFFLITSFALFVWHSWRKHEPMVDLKLLKNRNFGVGCLLIFFFGIAIYSTVVVLPLFYQELLGYTAFTAGLVVAPRGLGTICGLPAIGYLSNRVDPRYLLTFGFLVFGLTTLYFGNVTLAISPTTLLIPIMISGFGLSCIFVPISIAAYRHPAQRTDGQRQRHLQPHAQHRRLHRNLPGHNAAHPPHRRPPERDPQLRPPHQPPLPELPLRRPTRPRQLLRPRQLPPPSPVPPLRRAPPPGRALGLRRRLPLPLPAQLPLPCHRLALQKSHTPATLPPPSTNPATSSS